MPRRRTAVRPEPPVDPWHDAADPARRDPPGCRVVIDLRPLQDPDRAPMTAAYLSHLLGAYAANPLPGESFITILEAGLPDPTPAFDLPIAGRRTLPPTRRLRSAALTLDPFLLRGVTFRIGHGSPSPAVHHMAGAGMPLASRLPIVATLLDLAPWELPDVYQASRAARFGARIRAQMLHDAEAVVVGTESTASAAARLLHLHRDRVHVVPLAADPTVAERRDRGGRLTAELAEEERRLGLPERYLAVFGRYDARVDLPTMLDALAALRDQPRPETLASDVPWPPTVVLLGASPDDRAAVARALARRDLDSALRYAPYVPPDRLATLAAGARAVIVPSISDAAGLRVVDTLACGTPVIASAVGALPELVGSAGILVEPRNPARLARAIEAVWCDEATAGRLHEEAARVAAASAGWTWRDVARATRRVYAAAAALG